VVEFLSRLPQPAQEFAESHDGDDHVTFHFVLHVDRFPVDGLLGVERDVKITSIIA